MNIRCTVVWAGDGAGFGDGLEIIFQWLSNFFDCENVWVANTGHEMGN